ncbi:MAG: SUMF1/EgtB/PvdO family nonheme iron enzyme [Pseudomonadota bacterium]
MRSELQCTSEDVAIGSFVSIPAGQFKKGLNATYPEERPEINIQVGAFRIQTHEVTNDQFAEFVDATGYETTAEQSMRDGGRDAGSALFIQENEEGGTAHNRWELVSGATWHSPGGPDSNIEGLGNYPVVHVSQADAAAYAAWAGGRLPSEVEWEYAALLGLSDPSMSESGAFDVDGKPVANTWQGMFPFENTAADGSVGLSPVGCYPESEIGLYDMIGNSWEWTSTPYAAGRHTIKGGSFLCADNFCQRYRPAARQPHETNFSTNHIGFRIVREIGAE